MNDIKSLEDRIAMLEYRNRLLKAVTDGLNDRITKIEESKNFFLEKYESQRGSSARNLAVVNVGRVLGQEKMASQSLGQSLSREEERWGPIGQELSKRHLTPRYA